MISVRRFGGFTFVELVVVVTIIAIIAVVMLPRFAGLIGKSREATVKGHLGSIRSAITLYYSDNDGEYPVDDLASLMSSGKYLTEIPTTLLRGLHPDSNAVENNDDLGLAAILTTDNGRWKYWNWKSQTGGGHTWGNVWVGCSHTDSRGTVWSSY